MNTAINAKTAKHVNQLIKAGRSAPRDSIEFKTYTGALAGQLDDVVSQLQLFCELANRGETGEPLTLSFNAANHLVRDLSRALHVIELTRDELSDM